MLRAIARRTGERQIALAAMLAAVVLGHLTPILSKVLYASGWTPLALYFAVLLVMSMVLAVHEFIAIERGERWGMTRQDIGGTVIGAVTGGVIEPILFFTGLQEVTASDAILLTGLLPFFVVFFAVLFLRERFTVQTIAGSAFLVLALVVLLWDQLFGAELNPGALLIVGASLMAALTLIVHKKFVKHRHLDSVVLVRTFISTLLIGTWLLVAEPQSFAVLARPLNVWLFLAVPICGFLLPFFLYHSALQLGHVKAMDAGFVSAAGKVIGMVLAAALLGEILTPRHALSVVCTVIGILLINVPLTRLRIVPSRLPDIGPLRK